MHKERKKYKSAFALISALPSVKTYQESEMSFGPEGLGNNSRPSQ